MTAKHTPGPWRVYGSAGAEWSRFIWGADTNPERDFSIGGYLAVIVGDAEADACAADTKTDANARLIAAAPELLSSAAEIDHFLLVIESAVRNSDPANLDAVLVALKANRAAIAKATP